MNIYLVGIIVAAVFYIVCYISLNSFILAIFPAVLALIYFIFLAQPQLKKCSTKINAFKKCNQFINNFIVALSIQPSIENSFKHSLSTLDSDFVDSLGGIETLNDNEKLHYLSNYFPFHIYQIFVSLVELWQEQGGDILKMSNFLVNQSREIDEYIGVCEQLHNKKTIEFVILWVFALAILVVLRFALSQFYMLIIDKPMFQIGVMVIFLFAIFSIQMLIGKITHVEIRGWNKNGK